MAAVTIALLLLWSLENAFWAVWPLLRSAGEWLVTAIAILDIPYFSFSTINGWALIVSASHLYDAFVMLVAVVVISRWVYGVGPFVGLSAYRGKLRGWRTYV